MSLDNKIKQFEVGEGEIAKRAGYSRRFLENKGELEKFAQNLKSHFDIDVDVNDDKSFVSAIYNLQKKLGFPDVDNGRGCDGMFGPYTLKSYKSVLIKSESKDDRVEFNSNVVSPAVSGEQESLAEVKTEETVFVGDSLTVLMKPGIEGSVQLSKGGKQTGWMRKELSRFLAERAKGSYQNVKRIVILGGFNDLTSLKSLDSIKENLSAMFSEAQAVGISVVACTIPEWDYEGGLRIFKRDFAKHGWSGGVYPLSALELERRTAQLNEWIKKQNVKVVDLFEGMKDRKKYPRGDFVHLYGKGAKAMAELIKKEAQIV